MLHIQLLGSFSIKVDEKSRTTVNTPRLQSLLAYIILHRDTPQSRYHLASIFWPESEEAQARTNLRKLLHQLRQALPESSQYLRIEGQEVLWVKDVPLVFDVDEFENAVQKVKQGLADEQEHLTRAVQLYQGDLFPDCYDEWIEPERARLRGLLANALERLIAGLEKKRDYPTAIAYAERLLQLDDLNEISHRHLMRLHSLMGDRAGALRAFQTCAAVLKNELSVEPSEETRELYARIWKSDIDIANFTPRSTTPQIKPLVGREREWALMQQAWTRAAKGHPHCLILSGEAGIGKTRLAEEMLQWASRQGYRVAAAHCFTGEGGLAYAPIADWLRTGALRKLWMDLDSVWLTELARVLPEIKSERPNLPPAESLSADWQRRRLFEALARALSPAISPAAAAPIALLIDDIQWCDSETLAWLHYLLRSEFPAKLLLIGTLRLEELAPGHALESWLGDLRSAARLDEVELGLLNEVETKALAENEAGHALDPEMAGRLFAETEGHPLFVIETVRITSDPDTAPPDWIPSLEPNSLSPTSPTIQAVIARRLALLSPAARDLAGLAATIGHSFTYPVLVKASKESDEAMLVRALDELGQRRIIREHGTTAYDFSHDKLRSAAYQGLSTARRRYLHRCVAESLEFLVQANQSMGQGSERDDLAGQIGSQFEKAGLPDRAVPYYQQAAEVARRVFANEQALRYYQAALAMLRDPACRVSRSALAAQIEEQVGDLLLLMTLRADARAAFERGLQLRPPSERVERANLARKMGNTSRDAYHFEDSLAIYTNARQELGSPAGLDTEAELKWQQCWIQIQIEILNVYYWLAWIERSEDLFQEMRPVVERWGTSLQRADFFKLFSAVRLRANRYVATEEMVALSKTALEASMETSLPDRIPADRFGYGFIQLHCGDLDGAEKEMNIALVLAEQRGDRSLETRCLTYLTIVQRKRGDVELAMRLAQRALAAAETAKMPEYAGAARANLAWAALKSGDIAEARELGVEALKLWDQSPGIQAAATPYYWTAIWPLVRVCLDEGDLPGAFSYARRLLEPQRKGLPAELTAALGLAIDSWDANHPQTARDALISALTLAETLGEF